MLDVSTRRDVFFKNGKTLGQCISKSIAKKQKAAVFRPGRNVLPPIKIYYGCIYM
ncbi:unnamed protein product [Meloidogyne enterolobii]|uniref:Uncharacterized protein n=1 Tax=Meloidogyne enterolobii TaxID=390850 RepID=A0ACB1AXC1_MELEN